MRLWHHHSRKLLFCGITGSGKSYLSLQLLSSWKGQVFVFDHKAEIGPKLGWPVATTIQEMELQLARRQPCVFWPGREFPGNQEEAFDFWCKWVYRQCQKEPGKKVAYVDEIWRFQSTSVNGVPHSFAVIMQDGRTVGLDLVLTTHCLNDVHRKVRAMCNELYAFHQTDDEALKPLKGKGVNVETIKTLGVPGDYLWVNLETGEQKLFRRKGANADTRQKKIPVENPTQDLAPRNVTRLPRRDDMEKGKAPLAAVPLRKNLRTR